MANQTCNCVNIPPHNQSDNMLSYYTVHLFKYLDGLARGTQYCLSRCFFGLTKLGTPNIEATMADQFCRYYLHIIQPIARESHRTTLFSLCVLHFVFSPVATFGNTLVIQALRKTSLLPANMRKLFLSLALSDLAVG